MLPMSSLAVVLLGLSNELCDFSVPRDFRDVSRELPACVIVMRTYTCIARQHKLFTLYSDADDVSFTDCAQMICVTFTNHAIHEPIVACVGFGFGSGRQESVNVVTCCKLALYVGSDCKWFCWRHCTAVFALLNPQKNTNFFAVRILTV